MGNAMRCKRVAIRMFEISNVAGPRGVGLRPEISGQRARRCRHLPCPVPKIAASADLRPRDRQAAASTSTTSRRQTMSVTHRAPLAPARKSIYLAPGSAIKPQITPSPSQTVLAATCVAYWLVKRLRASAGDSRLRPGWRSRATFWTHLSAPLRAMIF